MYRDHEGESHFGYANDEMNPIVDAGDVAPTIEDGLELYNEAEDLVFADMPAIPLWFGRTASAYNANVSNVALDPYGLLDLTLVTLAD